MIGRLRALAKRSHTLNFNVVNRDAWVARQAVAVPAGSRVLDVCAGSCPYRPLFAHCEYRTQDFAQLSDDQLRHGGYGRIDYVCDAAEIPVPDGSFDVVLCTEVIEHLPDPVRVLREFHRVLKPGGRALVTAPLGSGIHQEPHHYFGGFTPYWYRRELPAIGFDRVDVQANAGSFAFYGQESLRFVRTSRPFALPVPLLGQLLWLPCWLVLAPILGLGVPLLCRLLDPYDREQRFTVGYHVIATKAL
jgi:SAM-dependent methyltransferase